MGNLKTSRSKKKKPAFKDFINWFEIPVLDLNRATAFYNNIYEITMEIDEVGDYSMAFFPVENGIGGALVMGPGSVPSQTGSLVYLNAGDDLQPILERVEPNGGRIVMEKTKIDDDAGYFALFIDSEGNKLALHSKK